MTDSHKNLWQAALNNAAEKTSDDWFTVSEIEQNTNTPERTLRDRLDRLVKQGAAERAEFETTSRLHNGNERRTVAIHYRLTNPAKLADAVASLQTVDKPAPKAKRARKSKKN